MIEIKIPSPGESITEVEILEWFVENGTYVEKDQEIAEIESDKATLPLIAPESGSIEIIAPAGETIGVGNVACKIDTSAKPKANAKPKKEEENTTIETIVPEQEITETKTPEPKQIDENYPKVKISPLAKNLMSENNLNIDDIINGLKRIGTKEVEQVISNKSSNIKPEKQEDTNRNIERKKISQLRKKLSERLVAVKNQTAMLTTFNEIDMTEILNIRTKYQKQFIEKHGLKLGFMSFFTKAV
ncbi:MAG: 2-oxo acid dehydrogenase subunit E2, partial [Bacteroidales bacterium]|nr:2-oxo acid dehydrogenase subunit E2 [Bacteroidales bacterium]